VLFGGFGGFGGGGDLGAEQEELARQFDETGGFGP
jgi:hypothetical protein